MIDIKGKYSISKDQISFQFVRSSGPGGQNVNKVNSKVIMSWAINENSSLPRAVIARFKNSYSNRINQDEQVVISSDQFRDQPQNIKACLNKLKSMIETVLYPPKSRIATKPTKGSKEKRLVQKKNRSDIKKNRKKIDF